MDKATAIQQAVWGQLVADGHPPPQTGNEAIAALPYGYNPAMMMGFLQLVANRLLADGFVFNNGAVVIDDALAGSINDLCILINHQTNPVG